MELLIFGMKYKESKCALLRCVSKICINIAKKKAEAEEKRLNKLNIRKIDEGAAQELLEKLENGKK